MVGHALACQRPLAGVFFLSFLLCGCPKPRVRTYEIRFHRHRRRPQRPGRRGLLSARRAQSACPGASRTRRRLRGHRGDLAGLSRLHRRLPHQPASGAHRPGVGTCALRLPGGCQRSRLLLRVSRRTPFLHVAGPRQNAGRNRQILASRRRSLPRVRRSIGAPLAGGGRSATDHAAAVPAARHRSHRLPETRRENARPVPARSRGAGQDLHAKRGRVPRRVVRKRGSQGHPRYRRGDRRQRRTALAGHGLHPAAPLHGRRGRTSRAVGFRARGMGAVSEAIAASARARGVEIRVNAPVAKVLVRNGRATGVVLETGEEIASLTVASNLDPKLTFLRLLDPGDLDPEFVRAIRNFRIEGTSCKINLALNGLPEFTAYPGAVPSGPGPHHKATMHICPSIDYVERAWDDAKYGRPSERPLLELTIPTMYDSSLAPPGKHIMGIFLQYAPYTLREGTWDELREPFGDRVISLIEEYAPNIRQLIEHRQVLSPLDLERRFGITGGNIFHGEMSLDQMF